MVAKYPRAVINGNSVITKMVVEVQLPGLKTWGDDAPSFNKVVNEIVAPY